MKIKMKGGEKIMNDTRETIVNATDYANSVRNATIAIARLLKIDPDKLMEALRDKEANGNYRASLASTAITVFLKEEADKAKEAKKNAKV